MGLSCSSLSSMLVMAVLLSDQKTMVASEDPLLCASVVTPTVPCPAPHRRTSHSVYAYADSSLMYDSILRVFPRFNTPYDAAPLLSS